MNLENVHRFSRQIALPEIGSEGQRAIASGHIQLAGFSPALESAARYLLASGVGQITRILPPASGTNRAGVQGQVADGALSNRAWSSLRRLCPTGSALTTVAYAHREACFVGPPGTRHVLLFDAHHWRASSRKPSDARSGCRSLTPTRPRLGPALVDVACWPPRGRFGSAPWAKRGKSHALNI